MKVRFTNASLSPAAREAIVLAVEQAAADAHQYLQPPVGGQVLAASLVGGSIDPARMVGGTLTSDRLAGASVSFAKRNAV